MKKLLRFLRFFLYVIVAIVALGGALFGYFVYTPAPDVPHLSGTLTTGSIDVGGLTRTYLTYVPKGLPTSAPLVLVMHGAGENGARIQLVTEIGIDPDQAFAAGSSRGGFMAFRLALEAPSTFRAVAAVSANVHAPANFKCKPAHDGTSSVMIMNGTEDPLVPFDGGEVSLFGFSYRYGRVMSSRESAQYFADLNHLTTAPQTNETQLADGVRVQTATWRNGSSVEVELVAVEGGGHGIPQPYRRHPRLLGPSPKEPNGPDVIWAFFARQRR
jgi:polyhydroxybutyrate depolymerase